MSLEKYLLRLAFFGGVGFIGYFIIPNYTVYDNGVGELEIEFTYEHKKRTVKNFLAKNICEGGTPSEYLVCQEKIYQFLN